MSDTHINVFLNSQDAITTDQPSDCTWTLDMRYTDFLNNTVELVGMCFSNLNYPINQFYNTLTVLEDDAKQNEFSVTFDVKLYDAVELATEIASKLNANSPGGETYTCTFNSQTSKLTLTCSTPVRILESSTCLRELGVDATGTSSFSADFEFANPVRLDGSEYVDIISSIGTRNVNSSGRTNILGRIYLDSAFGDLQYFQASIANPLQVYEQDITNLNIRLVDSRNNLFILPPNATVAYTLRLSI